MPPMHQKDAMKPGFAVSQIDTTTPHPARMYDAYLGGKDNYRAGREPGTPALGGLGHPLGSGVVVEDLG